MGGLGQEVRRRHRVELHDQPHAGGLQERFYNKLAARKHEIVGGGYKLAREIAAWKRKVSAAWDKSV